MGCGAAGWLGRLLQQTQQLAAPCLACTVRLNRGLLATRPGTTCSAPLHPETPRILEYLVLSLPGQQGSAIRRRLDCCWTAELALGALQLLDWRPEREAFQREQQQEPEAAATAGRAGDGDGDGDGEEQQQQRWEQHLCSTVYRRLQDRYGQQQQQQQQQGQQAAALPDAGDFDACMASLMQQLLAAARAQQDGTGALEQLPGPRRLALLLSNHSAGLLLLTLLTVDCGEGAKKEGG